MLDTPHNATCPQGFALYSLCRSKVAIGASVQCKGQIPWIVFKAWIAAALFYGCARNSSIFGTAE